MKRSVLAMVVLFGLLEAMAYPAPPVVEPKEETKVASDTAKELAAVKAENADLKKQLGTLSVQANGLLRKVGEQAKVISLLELEVERLTELASKQPAKN